MTEDEKVAFEKKQKDELEYWDRYARGARVQQYALAALPGLCMNRDPRDLFDILVTAAFDIGEKMDDEMTKRYGR